jgi:signal transduction histidine kinase/CheY-like chemotaxis protein
MDVIVVASSEYSIQESLRMLLGDEHMLVSAGTLPQLLNAVVEQPVDVVILDEFLENTDCASVFQRLRSLCPDLTCIMLAVQTRSDMTREMRAKGVYDVVAKPFDKEALLAATARALERARLTQRLAASKEAPAQTPGRPVLLGAPPDERAVAQRGEMLDSLRKFLKAVADVSAPERLHALVLEAVVEMFAVNRAALLLHSEDTRQMRMTAAVGIDTSALNGYRAAPWASVVSWLRKYDQILNLDDPDARHEFEEMLPVRKELSLLQARICVPLVAKGRLIGALVLGRKVTGKRLSDAELEFLYLLSQQIAAIIENAKQHRAVFVQKERFEEILQGVTSGLMATDSDGRLIVLNKAAEQILGLKASEVIGQSVQRAGSVFADIVFRTLRQEKSFCRQEVVDPATKLLLGISTSLVKHRGEDIDDAWQRCALCMAHEIKNPLVAIRTFTQLFPESYSDEKFRKEFSEIALKEIDKLDSVVERLLNFSQPLEARPELADIHSLLEEGIDGILETAQSQNITMKKNFEMANGRLPFDRNLLSEALTQIFRNALEAMPSGGTLTVSTRARRYPDPQLVGQENGIPPGMVAEVSISDTGAGISPEEMPNLFKPFHTSKVKGMGLGLAISRRIVRGHNGDIIISSEPNKGTEVKIVLPQGAS